MFTQNYSFQFLMKHSTHIVSSIGKSSRIFPIRTASANFQETWCGYVPQTNKQTKRDTSETEGQNTRGTTIGGGIPTEM